MVPDISNTSQSLIVNTYYIFKCNKKDRILVNKEIEKKYSMTLVMNLMDNISKTLDTNILHTSSHAFEPNGVSLTSVIESNEPMFGSSGVAHLRESHMSFHSYYENSLKDIIIMRLELHISSCSRKSVYFSFNDLSKNSHFENYDAITIDYFHRGLSLENLDKSGSNILDVYIQKKDISFELVEETKTASFVSLKLLKKKNKISPSTAYVTLYDHLN